jgi:DNA-binding SARP family transcriptional activator/DNA-binding beta-propeller fold protein YncE
VVVGSLDLEQRSVVGRLALSPAARYRRLTNELDFRVLGPLQVATNGSSLPLGGAKQRAVLALLLLHANEVVSSDRLIDELWAGSPPESAANIIHGYVSHLRKTLEPGRSRGEHELLVSRPPGYMLRARPEQIDAERFATLTGEARQLLDDGEADAAADRLRAALALWRGSPLADLTYESFARPDIERLEEARVAALEDRIDADLALGRDGDLVGELRKLVGKHPLRERLRGQLMVALYRSGRQADALSAYREGRRVLTEELGIEPGPALRDLERAILHHDAALGAPTMVPSASTRKHRRRWALLAAALAAATGAVAALVAISAGGSSSPQPVIVYPHSVAAIDPATDTVVDDILVGGYPTAIAADSRYLYVANSGDATVSRILPTTRKVFDTFALSRAIDLVADHGHLWAADGGVPGHTPIPPGTILDYEFGSAATRTLRVGPSRVGNEEQTTLATDGRGGPIWVGNQNSKTLEEIDPSLDNIVTTIRGIAPGGLVAIGNGSIGDTVWASDPSRDLVLRIDGNTGRVVRRIHVAGRPTRLAADNRAVWVITDHALRRIDARTTKRSARIALPITAKRVLLANDSVWVTGYRWSNHVNRSRGGMVIRIDPTTSRIVATLPIGDLAVDGITSDRGLIWIAVPPSA